jgi:uncharacterized glyoxalase superfamily protein PhnB
MAAAPNGIAPYFLVRDVRRAADYYRDKLGFQIGPYFREPPVFVIIQRAGMAIQLGRMEAQRGGSNRDWRDEAYDAYLWVPDADALYAEFRASGTTLLDAPTLKPYGMKEFDVRDADGYVLRFGQDAPNSRREG